MAEPQFVKKDEGSFQTYINLHQVMYADFYPETLVLDVYCFVDTWRFEGAEASAAVATLEKMLDN